jgi:putative ABC transport system permease protein
MRFRELFAHWFRRHRMEADLEEEFQLHMELRARKLRAAGASESEATIKARRDFGNTVKLKEESRMRWTFRWIEEAGQDLRYAGRTLRKAPSFTAAVVVTLALGLGLETALFTVFNSMVLRPFAIRDPYSLYQVSWRTEKEYRASFDIQEFNALRGQSHIFSDAAAIEPRFNANVNGQGMLGSAVSSNYFDLLGGVTTLGRPIQQGDQEGLVLSHQAWQERFNGDMTIVGRKLLVNGYPFEVVGVMAPQFVDPISFKFAPFRPSSRLLDSCGTAEECAWRPSAGTRRVDASEARS